MEITGYAIKIGSLEIAHPTAEERIVFLLFLLVLILSMYLSYFKTLAKTKKRKN